MPSLIGLLGAPATVIMLCIYVSFSSFAPYGSAGLSGLCLLIHICIVPRPLAIPRNDSANSPPPAIQ